MHLSHLTQRLGAPSALPLVLSVWALLFPRTAEAALPYPLVGSTGCDYGEYDCNVCARDVELSWAHVDDGTSDPRKLRIDANDDGGGVQPELTNACDEGRHLQGVGRIPVTGAPVFVASRNTGLAEWGESPGVFAAELEQIRSDGGNLIPLPDENDELNRVISYVTISDDGGVLDLPPVDHTGGLQTLGLLVVAGSACVNDGGYCGDVESRIDIFDFSVPAHPQLVSRFVPEGLEDGDPGMVGVTRLADGRYLLTANASHWYLSETTDVLTTGWALAATWSRDQVIDEIGDGDSWLYDPQNVSLVSDCDTGNIYMVTTDDSDGHDQAALYLVESDGAGGIAVRKRGHLWGGNDDGGDDPCLDWLPWEEVEDHRITFDAAANVYVSPEGNLILYATSKAEKDQDGDGDFRIQELHNHMNRCNDAYDVTVSPERDFTACDRGAAYDDDADGRTENSGDCNDDSDASYPGASEVADFDDNDCDGLVDEGTDAHDDDGDGFCEGIDDGGGDVPWCSDGSAPGDCDDADPMASPATPELPDGVDGDCDGTVDEGTAAYDDDGDGYAEAAGDCNDFDAAVYPGAAESANLVDDDCDLIVDEGTAVRDDDGDGWSEAAGDCDDADPLAYPGAPEQADGTDDDCDGTADEGTPAFDDDGDGWTEEAGDCDDFRADTYPGAEEVLDLFDNDCDTDVDEGTGAFDDDGDGWTEAAGDCDDARADVYPGAVEGIDGVDNDCDGALDEREPGLDGDHDGYSGDLGDCDDTRSHVYPGALEVEDGLDDDCDGLVDEGTAAFDDDGDGVSEREGDCDDASPDVHPGATESHPGVDDDCDGTVDELACDSCDSGGSPPGGGLLGAAVALLAASASRRRGFPAGGTRV